MSNFGEQSTVHVWRKLTRFDVLAIREAFAYKCFTQTELAVHHNVSVSTIRNAIHGRTWRHVAMPAVVE